MTQAAIRLRFAADGLLPLRLVRLCAESGVALEPSVAAAIPAGAHHLAHVSWQGIGAELQRLVMAEHAGPGLRLLSDLGLLAWVVPELCAAVRFDQRAPSHAYDVYEHSVRAAEAAPGRLAVRLAALLHDVAKPFCQRLHDDGTVRYPGHNRMGGEMARAALARLGVDRATLERTVFLVRYHMYYVTSEASRQGARRLVPRFGAEAITDLADLIAADCAALGRPTGRLTHVEFLRQMVREAGQAEAASVRLAVDGNDVMQELGVGPGPAVGRALRRLRAAVRRDPTLNRRETLLPLLRRQE